MTRIAERRAVGVRKTDTARRMQRRVVRRWVTLQEVKPDTSVIVPVLNEAENILPLVKRLSRVASGGNNEVLFIDDSNDDRTVDAVMLAQKKYCSESFKVHIYQRMPDKRWGGLSGAVSDGIARTKSDQIVIMDGDLQHPPETIANMIALSTNYDLVVASRYCKGGSARGLNGAMRHIVSRGSTKLAKAFFPFRLHPVSDPMTGFFLFNRKVVDTSQLHPKGFKILLEILATHPKLKVAEVPLQFAERNAGKSHGTLKQGLEFLTQLLSLRIRTFIRFSRQVPEFVQFGVIGGSVFAVGMAILYILIGAFNWSPLAANALQLATTFWLNYLLNRKITWRERKLGPLVAPKFLVSRAATTVLNYLLFAWLISLSYSFVLWNHTVNLAGHYLIANVISLAGIMVLNYFISDRWVFAEPRPLSARAKYSRHQVLPLSIYSIISLAAVVGLGLIISPSITLFVLITIASLALFIQSSVEVWRTVYSYRHPESVDRLRFPVPNGVRERFCIIVPARHESAVLADTLHQLSDQTHPNVSIITVICSDDYDTLRVARAVESTKPNIRVIEYPLPPYAKPSKPKQLNYVFSQIKNEDFSIIGVVDAEDTVHPGLMMHIDAAFRDLKVGIVQGGVQLMNHASSWFAMHNVLEYYRWFNSSMAFQADHNFMPLGGNTVFVRRTLLKRAGGWPETLTEDCSLGVLLSTRYWVKTAVYYEPSLATREETPDSLKGLFNQRVRWNQGFFHEWRKGIWRNLPTSRQRLLADYVLLSPILLAGVSVFIPISLLTALFLNAPVGLVILTYLPLVPISLLTALNAVFLHDFGKAYKREIRFRRYIVLLATQIPYQIVLNAAALWAVVRELRGETSWYKTPHSGQHRLELTHARAHSSPSIKLADEPLGA